MKACHMDILPWACSFCCLPSFTHLPTPDLLAVILGVLKEEKTSSCVEDKTIYYYVRHQWVWLMVLSMGYRAKLSDEGRGELSWKEMLIPIE